MSISLCTTCMQVSPEPWRGCQIQWNWSYRWLWAAVVGAENRTLQEQQVFSTSNLTVNVWMDLNLCSFCNTTCLCHLELQLRTVLPPNPHTWSLTFELSRPGSVSMYLDHCNNSFSGFLSTFQDTAWQLQARWTWNKGYPHGVGWNGIMSYVAVWACL